MATPGMGSKCVAMAAPNCYLADNPLAGDEIPGTGGVRKLRFAASGRGKRGGARAVCFYGGDQMPLYVLLVYAKSPKT